MTAEGRVKISIRNLDYSYGPDKIALKDVSFDIPEHQITVLFGPSGGGKTTLIRLLNRLNDRVHSTQMSGQILLDGQDIYGPDVDVVALRRRVGTVFALPIPLPGTVRQNVTYGPRMAGERRQGHLSEVVERALKQAALWDEVKDRLDEPAGELSGGQRQRLCIARTLALEPEVILLDEPTSGLDPISSGKVEETLHQLSTRISIIMSPSSIQQGARMADWAAFFLMGELVEFDRGEEVFTRPKDRRTEDYVTGRFG
jgi:phosphate transport system ATP-binding protein